jgi:hypothetical protein
VRRVLLISLALVLALSGWSAVGADDGFYVIPSMKVVPKTGQTAIYAAGDDGAWHKGVPSPTPRFTDNANGTVTDNLTRLIWMKNANAFGTKNWADALSVANNLKSGDFGLTDGSKVGDWRLPNLRELQSLFDYAWSDPALPNTAGTGKWVEGDPFQGVLSSFYYYWSSTTAATDTNYAWAVNFRDVTVNGNVKTSNVLYVWCVRGGP